MSEKVSSYLDLLPSVYRTGFPEVESANASSPDAFLGRFLRIFERILTENAGAPGPQKQSLRALIKALPEIFYPGFYFLFEDQSIRGREFIPELDAAAQAEFRDFIRTGTAGSERIAEEQFRAWLSELLTWLASWIDLTLHQHWDLERKRAVLASILPLYRLRGTVPGMTEILRLFFGISVRVVDRVRLRSFRVGETALGRKGTVVGGWPARYFLVIAVVDAKLTKHERDELARHIRLVVDVEKPVLTSYQLIFRSSK